MLCIRREETHFPRQLVASFLMDTIITIQAPVGKSPSPQSEWKEEKKAWIIVRRGRQIKLFLDLVLSDEDSRSDFGIDSTTQRCICTRSHTLVSPQKHWDATDLADVPPPEHPRPC